MKTEIIVAENAGFCFGVDRAVKIVYNILSEGKKVVTYGEIIHNKDVTRELSENGVKIAETLEDLSKVTEETVVIRSHGAGIEIFNLLDKNGIKYLDGTCPYVKRIHNIVKEKSAQGYEIIILGDKNHPEVKGIVSYCNNMAKICADDTELYEILIKNYTNTKKKVAIVAQTTYNISIWEKCIRLAAEVCPEAEVMSTVCAATDQRQRKAAELAGRSDLMIVVGGKHSSNTVKLAEICSKNCKACMHIENADGLDFTKIKNLAESGGGEKFIVGVTAGASTPAYIIKEVTNQMSEKLQNMEEDFNFEEALDASFKKIYTGQRVKGYITAVNDAEAIV
ncbi:MAG: 4-hydroxy-3-methylbut-2-enyl diphosphate reductase, partial [Oscillospiraceae bacterium]|nr:4-hydroxy-3-methylbut-2-enyl diphosphate reductase [Oscillospiraceae bacterium]